MWGLGKTIHGLGQSEIGPQNITSTDEGERYKMLTLDEQLQLVTNASCRDPTLNISTLTKGLEEDPLISTASLAEPFNHSPPQTKTSGFNPAGQIHPTFTLTIIDMVQVSESNDALSIGRLVLPAHLLPRPRLDAISLLSDTCQTGMICVERKKRLACFLKPHGFLAGSLPPNRTWTPAPFLLVFHHRHLQAIPKRADIRAYFWWGLSRTTLNLSRF